MSLLPIKSSKLIFPLVLLAEGFDQQFYLTHTSTLSKYHCHSELLQTFLKFCTIYTHTLTHQFIKSSFKEKKSVSCWPGIFWAVAWNPNLSTVYPDIVSGPDPLIALPMHTE